MIMMNFPQNIPFASTISLKRNFVDMPCIPTAPIAQPCISRSFNSKPAPDDPSVTETGTINQEDVTEQMGQKDRFQLEEEYLRSKSAKDKDGQASPSHQLVWKARSEPSTEDTFVTPTIWNERVADSHHESLEQIVLRISNQEQRGARLRSTQYGVLHEDPAQDMEWLTQNYTVSALASAVRDREESLQYAAVLAQEERWPELKEMLSLFHPATVLARRDQRRRQGFNVSGTLDMHALEVIRKALMRMPRTVNSQAHSKRAGVVIPLCSVNGVPSLLLEKRSAQMRAHPDEVCLPGGMVCEVNDSTIVATCLREMQEEIGGLVSTNIDDASEVQVLGVFRCNWGEVHNLVGIAVTPVVCFLGELPRHLQPNPSEVSEVFTIPLASLLKKHYWIHEEHLAPIFLGGPHVIWGLTGYILEKFCKDILLPNSVDHSQEL